MNPDSFITSSWCVHMSNVHSKWHARSIVVLWTCKRDAKWKWSFYIRVSSRENMLRIISPFARVAFFDLIRHLKFCWSGLYFKCELTYSACLSFIQKCIGYPDSVNPWRWTSDFCEFLERAPRFCQSLMGAKCQ